MTPSPLALPPLRPDGPSSGRLFRMSATRREIPQVKLALGGRVMLEDRSEYGATAVAGSLRAVSMECEASPRLGERIIGYFYAIGRLEGTVSRLTEKGMVIDLVTSPLKRDKLSAQMTWLANRDILNLPEDRRHDRVVPSDPRITLRQLSDPSGNVLNGHLIDVSRSGAAASVRGATFRRGEEVMLGTTPARVVRVLETGIAVEFYAQIPEHMFSERIRL